MNFNEHDLLETTYAAVTFNLPTDLQVLPKRKLLKFAMQLIKESKMQFIYEFIAHAAKSNILESQNDHFVLD